MELPFLENLPDKMIPFPSGALPLLERSFFPWEGLPYPNAHAAVGLKFCKSEKPDLKKLAEKMAFYQEATLDHYLKPLPSLFQQEFGFESESAIATTHAFFEAVGKVPSKNVAFSDSELGLIVRKDESATLVAAASGCKSGLGIFLSHDAGVLNCGPHLNPVSDTGGFGLAGRGQNILLEEQKDHFSLAFTCRLAAPHPTSRSVMGIQDSGYSGLWTQSQLSGNLKNFYIKNLFLGDFSPKKAAFSFFGRARMCIVAGSHILKPKSLDRYYGPPQPLLFAGERGGIRIIETEGVSHMEVIPLSGEMSYWGADFLVVYSLASQETAFSLQNITI